MTVRCLPCVGTCGCVGPTGSRKGRKQINFQLYQQVDLTCHVPVIAGGDKKKGRRIQLWVWVQIDWSWRWNHILKSSIREEAFIFRADVLCLEKDFCVAFIFLVYGLLHPAIRYHLSACSAGSPPHSSILLFLPNSLFASKKHFVIFPVQFLKLLLLLFIPYS